MREGGMADTKSRRGKETGRLGSAHCQLKHWNYATVAGSKTFSQITDTAQSRSPSTDTPLSDCLFGLLPHIASSQQQQGCLFFSRR